MNNRVIDKTGTPHGSDAFHNTSIGTSCRQNDGSLLLNRGPLWPDVHPRLCKQGPSDVVPGRAL